jgi:ComF family protein
LFDFDDTIQAIVHEFKYAGIKRLAFDMGKKYADLVPRELFTGMDAMVAVPLHLFRFMKRGYNQAEYFAKGLSAGMQGISYLPHVLFRKRHTKTQTKLSRNRRTVNVEGAFAIFPGNRNLIKDKNLILVDDIITTAATTAECARTLKDAGCGTIRVLSLARD